MQSLWDRLGGEANVRSIVHDFVTLVTSDPAVDYSRGGRFPTDGDTLRHAVSRSFAFISMATGGPFGYQGRCLKEIHETMGITDREFDAATRDFRLALERNGVGADVVATAFGLLEATRRDIVTWPGSCDGDGGGSAPR